MFNKKRIQALERDIDNLKSNIHFISAKLYDTKRIAEMTADLLVYLIRELNKDIGISEHRCNAAEILKQNLRN